MTVEQKAEKYAKNLLKDVTCNIGHPRVRQINSIDIEDAWLYGYKEGFKDCAKSRLNVTTISDCPIKDDWHYVKDGDLPKDFGYYLVALKSVAYKGFVFEVVYFTGSIFTKEGEISDNVYAWKEIVLPKENDIKSEMFPKITLPKGSAEFVDKAIADAKKRLKEIEK